MICDHCGYGVTASWSRSGTGRRYAYYHCYHCYRKKCSQSGKGVSKKSTEEQFEQILQSVAPSQEVHELARTMFRDAWEKRSEMASIESNRLKTETRKAEAEIETVLDRLVRTKDERTADALEARVSQLRSKQAVLEEKLAKLSGPDKSFEEMFELSMNFLANPYKI